jgi:hypothetical protein
LHAEADNHDLHATLEGMRGKHTSNVLLEVVDRPTKARVAVDWGRSDYQCEGKRKQM